MAFACKTESSLASSTFSLEPRLSSLNALEYTQPVGIQRGKTKARTTILLVRAVSAVVVVVTDPSQRDAAHVSALEFVLVAILVSYMKDKSGTTFMKGLETRHLE